jgi:integrase/recombinase XerD
MSPDETKRLLAVDSSLKARILLSLGYGCGLRAGEVIRLKVKHIDSAQKIIRIEQSKSRKDRNVMLSADTLELLRQWWKARPSRYDDDLRQAVLLHISQMLGKALVGVDAIFGATHGPEQDHA